MSLKRLGYLLAAVATVLVFIRITSRRPLSVITADTLSPPTTLETPTEKSYSKAKWGLIGRPISLLVGALALVWLSLINGDRGLVFAPQSAHLQFGLLVIGIVLIAGGLLNPDELIPRRSAQLKMLLPVVAIILFAFGVRIWQLDSWLRAPVADEIHFASAVIRLWQDDDVRILLPFHAINSFTWVYPYLQMLTAEIGGHSIWSVRLTSAVFGTLTVVALYLLVRELFDHKTGLTAAFLLAMFAPHIHYSHVALNNIADPFWGTLSLAFIARGARTKKKANFVLAGLFVGLTQFFYEAGRLLFLPLSSAWLIMGALKCGVRLKLRNILIVPVLVIVIAAPLYYSLFTHGLSLTSRLENQRVTSREWKEWQLREGNVPLAYLQNQLLPILRNFIAPAEGSDNLIDAGGVGIILPPLVPFFLLGIAYCFRHIDQWRIQLVLLWFGAVILGISLIHIPLWTIRYVVLFPAIALVLALGCILVVRRICPPAYQTGVLIFLTALFAVIQIHYYFNFHIPVVNTQIRNGDPDYYDAVYRSRSFPADSEVYIVDREFVFDYVITFKTLLGVENEFRYLNVSSLTPEQLCTLPPDIDRIFFVTQADVSTPAILRGCWENVDGPSLSPYADVPQGVQLALYFVPAIDS